MGHPTLVKRLQDPRIYPHPVTQVDLIETHLSWIFLTGRYAYKMKKPLDLGFADFSTLEKRRFYCHEELRLNQPLAPEIYLEVIAVGGSAESPGLGGNGEPIDYLLKMREFPQSNRLDRVFERGELTSVMIDELVAKVALGHADASRAGSNQRFGGADQVCVPVNGSMGQIRQRLMDTRPGELTAGALSIVEELKAWCDRVHRRLREAFQQRKEEGFIRDCHGDLHLANMALVDGRLSIFDRLEFDERLRWIDLMSDVAFVVMDLDYRQAEALGWHFLNGYLEQTGDYQGLLVLPYYLVYRALVRAKVALIRSTQVTDLTEARNSALKQFSAFLELARHYTERRRPILLLMHGLSGSGKSWLSRQLVTELGAIRVRTDVERKRGSSRPVDEPTPANQRTTLYQSNATMAVYQQVARCCGAGLSAGYSMIADGTFLYQWQRDQFRLVAQSVGVPLVILDLHAPHAELERRLRGRTGDSSDANLDVLATQIATAEPLSAVDQPSFIGVEVDQDVDLRALIGKIREKTG